MATDISKASLVGTWELLSREDVNAQGQRRIEPNLGANPIAYLMYDAAGHFAVQFMRRERGGMAASLSAVGGSNNTSPASGYDAYFGKYRVDVEGMVIQELVGALSPGDVGKVVTRRFRVNADELIIELETMNGEEPVTRTLRWRRVG